MEAEHDDENNDADVDEGSVLGRLFFTEVRDDNDNGSAAVLLLAEKALNSVGLVEIADIVVVVVVAVSDSLFFCVDVGRLDSKSRRICSI